MTLPSIFPALADGQWSLDGLVMGRGTKYNVQGFEFQGADLRVQDADRQGWDGDRFGVDTRGGRTIRLDLNTDAYTMDEGLAWNRALSAAWDAERTRRIPGAVQCLRWRRGQRVFRAYGRSREYLCDHGMDWTGNIGVTASFRTVEPRFYDDVETTEIVGLVPDQVGGLVGDLIGDIIASGAGVDTIGFTVGGDVETWATILIHGPITNPKFQITDQWSVNLATTIAANDFVLVDPTPWGGPDIRRGSDGANFAGRLTADSRTMPEMKIAPGNHTASLSGVDPTGSAYAVIYVRDATTEH